MHCAMEVSVLLTANRRVKVKIGPDVLEVVASFFYTQKKKFSQYLCFLIKSTIMHISLSNFLHELYYRNFTFNCLLRDK